ncbi:MAG: DUF3379 family protein [Gammaproteobacteria bacterium]|nr:DUF3379 family protein [Gammaproteobacteria bacterium]
MNCIDYRRLIGSEPSHAGAEGLRHRLACPACASYTDEMQQLDTRIRQAMTTQTPPQLGAKIVLAASSRATGRRRWLALAATLVLAIGGTVAVLSGYGIEELPHDVISHLYHEADLLVPVSTDLVPAERLIKVLNRTGVELNQEIEQVIHAGVCLFRGHLVSHLVVMSDQGPVTLLLLPDEKVKKSMQIDEDGFRGVIVPVQGGSIAIIGSGTFPALLERQISQAVQWKT